MLGGVPDDFLQYLSKGVLKIFARFVVSVIISPLQKLGEVSIFYASYKNSF